MSKGQNKILVTQPQVFTDESLPYVTYLVSGADSKGPFSIRRRYRDFYLLRQRIVDRWPGLYIPPISSKKVSGNTQSKFVELRRKFLHYFCEKIAQREYLFSSDVFQLFIRGSGDFEKSVKELESIDYEALSVIYQKNFVSLTQDSSQSDLQMNCENDYDFLKNAQKKLQRIREDLRNLSSAKADYEKQFNICMGNSLPDYEEKFLIKYVENDRSKLFLNNGEEFATKLKEYQEYTSDNALEDYCQLISYQLREMRAFTQAIDSRKRAEETKLALEKKRNQAKEQVEKLKSGKTTLKSFFSAGKKQDQIRRIQEQISKSEKDEEALCNMIFLMNAAICHELSQYKNRRRAQYRRDVERINKKQIKEMSLLGQLLEIPLRVESGDSA